MSFPTPVFIGVFKWSTRQCSKPDPGQLAFSSATSSSAGGDKQRGMERQLGEWDKVHWEKKKWKKKEKIGEARGSGLA